MEKCLKLISNKQNRIVCILFLLVLLLAKSDLVLKEGYSKKNLVKALSFGNGKKIFVLLIEIIAFYIAFTIIYIPRLGFQMPILRFFRDN